MNYVYIDISLKKDFINKNICSFIKMPLWRLGGGGGGGVGGDVCIINIIIRIIIRKQY